MTRDQLAKLADLWEKACQDIRAQRRSGSSDPPSYRAATEYHRAIQAGEPLGPTPTVTQEHRARGDQTGEATTMSRRRASDA